MLEEMNEKNSEVQIPKKITKFFSKDLSDLKKIYFNRSMVETNP